MEDREDKINGNDDWKKYEERSEKLYNEKS